MNRMLTVVCPYCNQGAELVTGKTLYPHRPDLYEKYFWWCKKDEAYVGTHVNSARHHPLGRLANAQLRTLKQKVHALFDPLWKKGAMKRKEAYKKLAAGMGIAPSNCHIGMFDESQCRLALEVLGKPSVKD